MNIIWIISVFCVIVDQISKLVVSNCFKLNQSLSIIPSFFSLTYVKNEGAAWSLFSGNLIFLIIITLLALFLIYFFLIKNGKKKTIEKIGYGLLYGGIFGNLIDRICRGYVIDFFDFTIIKYHFPVFNIADICIVLGVLFVIICIWKEEKS